MMLMEPKEVIMNDLYHERVVAVFLPLSLLCEFLSVQCNC